MSCPGSHCKGCGRGSGRVLVALVGIGAAVVIAKPVQSGARTAGHVITDVVIYGAIALAIVLGVALVVGITWTGVRVHRFAAPRLAARRSVRLQGAAEPIPLPAVAQLALEPAGSIAGQLAGEVTPSYTER